uniref:Uncharacterized protein n=1 Tax=Ralstonia syzygii R24 TaxID=907261 RepID=G3ABD1_9RALS|nr:hypothetical protein RALSY_mp30132 [Ralstonia syzygii R24]
MKANVSRKQSAAATSEFAQIKTRINRLMVGNDP